MNSSEISKTFCILPWVHLMILPNGLLRICCLSKNNVMKNGIDLSVYNARIGEIWNSDHLRSIRKNMTEGKETVSCSHCYQLEKISGNSHRIVSNARWSAELGRMFEKLVDESKKRDFAVMQLPIYWQLIPGNLCNLKCRMCFPLFSSEIARDEIHRKWIVGSEEIIPDSINWTAEKVTIAPRGGAGIEMVGFHALETSRDQPLRWTNGDSVLRFSLPQGLEIDTLLLKLWGFHPNNHALCISINEYELFQGVLAFGEWKKEFEIPSSLQDSCITVRLRSDTFRAQNDRRALGIALKGLELSLVKSCASKVAAKQNSEDPYKPRAAWFEDAKWVSRELLKSSDKIRGHIFYGR